MSEHDQISVDSSLYHQLHGNGDELSSTYSDPGQIPLSYVYKMEMLGKIQDYATSRMDAFYASKQSSAGYSVVESSNGKSGFDEVISQSKHQSLSLSHHGIQLSGELSNLGGLKENKQLNAEHFRDNGLDMNAVANVDDDNDDNGDDGEVNGNVADYGGGGADQSEKGTDDDDVEGDDDSTHLSLADLQPVRQIEQQLNSIKSALISHQVDLNVAISDRRRGTREDDDSESCWDVVEMMRLNPRKCAIGINLLSLIPALVLLTPKPSLADSNVYVNKSFETVNSDHYLMVLGFVAGVMSPVQVEILLRSVKFYLCFGPNEDREIYFNTFTSENALQIYKNIIFRATFVPFAIILFYGMVHKRETDGYSSGGKRLALVFLF